MSRRIGLALALAAVLAVPQARGQEPFPRDLIPTRTALARVGLTRQWMQAVPLVNEERLLLISLADGLVFAQTNRANFHVLEAETGRVLWSVNLGTSTARARPASVNSYAVFVTSMNRLFALDRRTGRTIWSHELGALPSSATAADEERVMVGLSNGMVHAFNLKTTANNQTVISDRPLEVWSWQTSGIVETRPVLTVKVAAFGSDDGKLYVGLAEERTLLYRIATGGAIGKGIGTLGTRLMLVPSADRNLYAVDLFTAQVLWTFATGSGVDQEPLVADNEILVVNNGGELTSVDPLNGNARWTTSTQGGRLLSVGPNRVYLESFTEDLMIVDRATGRMIADPRATHERVGLNLRPYDLGITNAVNDRIYLATSSGLIIALREPALTTPRLLRDPKAQPFGYVPPEGLVTTPPASPAPAPTTTPPAGEAAPDAAAPDAAAPGEAAPDAAAPAAELVPPPAEEPK